MKKFLMVLVLANLSGAAWAKTFHCESASTGYVLDVLLQDGGFGQRHGTGTLSQSGGEVAKLGCTYTTGITNSLKCSGAGYKAFGYGDHLGTLTLQVEGSQDETLTCN